MATGRAGSELSWSFGWVRVHRSTPLRPNRAPEPQPSASFSRVRPISVRRHVVLTLVTLGLWLFVRPAIVLWRHGLKGAAAAWSGAVTVLLIVIGSLGGGSDDAAVSAEPGAPSTPARALVAPAQKPTPENATALPQEESAAAVSTAAMTPSPPPATAPAAAATARVAVDPAPTPAPAPAAPRTTAAAPPPAPEPEPAPEPSPPSPPAPVEPVAPAPEPPPPPVVARTYQNCDALNVDYPHGVGRAGAVDRVSGGGSPVTTFEVNDEVYAGNTGRDRDDDQIACERA